MPTSSAMTNAATVRVSVAPPLSRTTCRTGWLSLKVVPKSRRSDRGQVVPVLRDQRLVEAERLTPLVERLLVELAAERGRDRVAGGHPQDEEDQREDHPDHRDHQQDALQDVPRQGS